MMPKKMDKEKMMEEDIEHHLEMLAMKMFEMEAMKSGKLEKMKNEMKKSMFASSKLYKK